MGVHSSKIDFNGHKHYGTTTITISKENHKTLQELAIEGQSFDQVLSQILRNKNMIIKLLIEQHQEKLQQLGSGEDDQSATDAPTATRSDDDDNAVCRKTTTDGV